MDVILLERVGRLGRMGDTVKVKDGFARNFLLPNHKALRATEANKAKFERERAVLEVKNNDSRGIAEAEAESLKGKSFVVIRQAGESGQLYGSVSTRDISEAALAAGAHVDKNHVHLRAPIKAIGMHEVELTLHPEVVVKLQVNVARSAAEADAQARGEVMTGNAAERAEVRAAAEALFEEAQADQAAEEAAEDAAPVSKTRAKAKAKKPDIE